MLPGKFENRLFTLFPNPLRRHCTALSKQSTQKHLRKVRKYKVNDRIFMFMPPKVSHNNGARSNKYVDILCQFLLWKCGQHNTSGQSDKQI